MKTFTLGLILISALVTSSIVLTPLNSLLASSKGLKVYLTTDSNQPTQVGTAYTYQFGDQIYSQNLLIEDGITEFTLEYPRDLVETGDFRISVNLNNGVNGCGNGYNSPEKKPESVHVTIRGSSSDSGSSSASSSSSQSQSQSTTIINCPSDSRCVIKES